MTEEELNKIEKLCDSATVGPWREEYGFNNGGCATGFFYIPGHNSGAKVEMLADDSAFIVMARESLPVLISEIRKLQKVISKKNV